jgi:hypothetical protein
MDGVLTDFSSRYTELFGVAPAEVEKKHWSTNWKSFVENNNFATLDWFPGGKEMYAGVHEYAKKHKLQLHILTSAGGTDYVEEIALQKRKWLLDNGIKHRYLHVVPGKRYKKEFAEPSRLLIDDTESNVVKFRLNNGKAIHHVNDHESTLNRLWSGNYED